MAHYSVTPEPGEGGSTPSLSTLSPAQRQELLKALFAGSPADPTTFHGGVFAPMKDAESFTPPTPEAPPMSTPPTPEMSPRIEMPPIQVNPSSPVPADRARLRQLLEQMGALKTADAAAPISDPPLDFANLPMPTVDKDLLRLNAPPKPRR